MISVIVNTKDEEKNIGNCLQAIRQQNFASEEIEIIVVDNNSTDKTKEIALRYTDKVFDKGPERSAQKNFGVEKAQGQWFVHLDADMIISQDVLKECMEKVEKNPDIVALFFPEKVLGNSFFSKVRNFERSFYNATVVDGVRFIKKDAFLQINGFDENMYACEDWDLTKRIKQQGKVDIIQAVLYHNEAEFSVKKYLSKKGYYTQNMSVYLEKWKDDPDLKKQFGIYYRFFGIFVENGKWKKLLSHPWLAAGMYFLRLLVGGMFLIRKRT